MRWNAQNAAAVGAEKNEMKKPTETQKIHKEPGKTTRKWTRIGHYFCNQVALFLLWRRHDDSALWCGKLIE